MIEVRDLNKSFNGQKVLQGLNLDIKKGEMLAVTGGSGSGKTVFLRHLIGMMRPDSGEIFVKGRPIFTMDERQLEEMRRLFGFVFQSGALLNSLTVYENVALPLTERRKVPRKEIPRLVEEKLRLVSLEGVENQLPSSLSGGMKKRVAIARAIIEDPEIILYDEPTSELDPVIASSIEELMISLKKDLGVTSVVVIHDMHVALRIADRIALLSEGNFVEIGPPSEIINSRNEQVKKFLDRSIKDCEGRKAAGA